MVMAVEAMSMVREASGDLLGQYLRSFERTGDLNDLQTAIQKGEEAVEAIPRDHPEQSGCRL